MKVLTNHPEPTLIRGVSSLLLRAIVAEPGQVCVVSPWFKDVRLPLAQVGSFRTALGGDPEEASLGELLERLADRHTMNVITKPPAELVDLVAIRRIVAKRARKASLATDPDLTGFDVVDEVSADFDADVEELAERVSVHVETLEMAARLEAAGAAVAFLPRLHAKVIWTPQGALLGSANLTHGGLLSNDELAIEVTDRAAHAALHNAVVAMHERAEPARRHRVDGLATSLGLSANSLAELRDAADCPPNLRRVLKALAPFLTPVARRASGE